MHSFFFGVKAFFPTGPKISMGKQHCKYSNEFQVNILFPLNVLPILKTVGGIVLSMINKRIKT